MFWYCEYLLWRLLIGGKEGIRRRVLVFGYMGNLFLGILIRICCSDLVKLNVMGSWDVGGIIELLDEEGKDWVVFGLVEVSSRLVIFFGDLCMLFFRYWRYLVWL